MACFIKRIRDLELALGSPIRYLTEKQKDDRKLLRRSPYALNDYPAGTPLRDVSVIYRRPGLGLSPAIWESLTNSEGFLYHSINEGQLITEDHVRQKILSLLFLLGVVLNASKKEYLPFRGQPLISWTIHSAIHSGVFQDIFVSTDDSEIADISLESGAKVLMRPSHLADDISRVDQVCLHHLHCGDISAVSNDFLYCLYPTSPAKKQF